MSSVTVDEFDSLICAAKPGTFETFSTKATGAGGTSGGACFEAWEDSGVSVSTDTGDAVLAPIAGRLDGVGDQVFF